MTVRRGSVSYRIARLPLPIRGRRVLLALPAFERVAATARLLNDRRVHRGTLRLPYPYAEKDARAWIRRARRDRKAGRSLGLSIVRRSDGELLGGVGLYQLEAGAARAEVGYWLGREHWGHGYATEAVKAILRVAFRELGLHRIEARVYPWNVASSRVVRRCGFRYEGRLRDEVQKDGRWHSTLLFSRLATDPPVSRRRR
jgi:RimJ/RimL family protein N-acetyltransferase